MSYAELNAALVKKLSDDLATTQKELQTLKDSIRKPWQVIVQFKWECAYCGRTFQDDKPPTNKCTKCGDYMCNTCDIGIWGDACCGMSYARQGGFDVNATECASCLGIEKTSRVDENHQRAKRRC